MSNQTLRGIIYVTKNDKILIDYANGFANEIFDELNHIDIKYATASAGKVFVAISILQLIELNQLSFIDTIGSILTDIDFKEIDPDVTVKQLLTHTSGVPDYFDETTMNDYEELWLNYPNYKIRHNHDIFPLFIDQPMMYPRGERFQYNNTGYVILAAIIEKISGVTFDHYIQKQIFDVSNMCDSGYYELDKLPKNSASNYIYINSEKTYKTNIFSVDAKGTGAGGAFVSVLDIIKFWDALNSNKLLSKEMTKNMLSIHSGNQEEGYYGLGVWIYVDQSGNLIPSFQGMDPGVSFFTEFNYNQNICSILVSNYGDNVWKEMRDIRETFY